MSLGYFPVPRAVPDAGPCPDMGFQNGPELVDMFLDLHGVLVLLTRLVSRGSLPGGLGVLAELARRVASLLGSCPACGALGRVVGFAHRLAALTQETFEVVLTALNGVAFYVLVGALCLPVRQRPAFAKRSQQLGCSLPGPACFPA